MCKYLKTIYGKKFLHESCFQGQRCYRPNRRQTSQRNCPRRDAEVGQRDDVAEDQFAVVVEL